MDIIIETPRHPSSYHITCNFLPYPRSNSSRHKQKSCRRVVLYNTNTNKCIWPIYLLMIERMNKKIWTRSQTLATGAEMMLCGFLIMLYATSWYKVHEQRFRPNYPRLPRSLYVQWVLTVKQSEPWSCIGIWNITRVRVAVTAQWPQILGKFSKDCLPKQWGSWPSCFASLVKIRT